MIDEPERPVNRASHAVLHPRIGIRKPRIMRENKNKGSRSIDGGILVYPRKEAPGKWMVMWRTPEGRRYRSFETLTSANFFASDLQQERRHNGTRPVHSVLTAAESKYLEELRAATKGAKLSDLLAAWKDYQAKQTGLTIGEVAHTADMVMRATNPDYYSPRSSWDWASQLVLQVRRRDPEQWAYYYIRDKATQWKQAKTGVSREQGGYDSPDAEALRNFRRSIYAGDVEAAKRLYVRLLGYGYTAQRFEQGIKASEPLAELSAKDGSRRAFVDGLSPYDRRMLEKAQAYEARLSALKVDARRLFPLEIKGFPAATQRILDGYKSLPK
jgi:hypothetical protein